MSYNARPKRPAEDYARTHHVSMDANPSEHPSKKPKFDVRNPSALAPDAPEEDAVLDADVIGNRGQQVRRGAVNVDGYDSDSDNENFDTRADAKVKAREAAERSAKEVDENDMFADLEDDFKDGDNSEGDGAGQGGKKKAVRFMEENEIEGQVQNSKSGGHVSVDFRPDRNGKKKMDDDENQSSSESEVDDETRASAGDIDDEIGAGGKKTHAPKLDAFNMKSENEEGKFDEQGNYVRKATDPDSKHDIWLEGLSKKDMNKARDAHEKREEDRRKRALEDDAKSTADILKALIPLLQIGETPLEALSRLNKNKDKRPKWAKKVGNKFKDGSEQKSSAAIEAKEEILKTTIEAITEATDLLLSRGQMEVYEAEKELLIRQYRRESGQEWKDEEVHNGADEQGGQTLTKTWEYRWSDARDGGQVHGPFDGTAMEQWRDAGYFGEGIEFRQIGSEVWSHHAVDFI